MWCVNGCVVMKNVCCVHYLYEYLCCDTCAQRTRKDTVAEWLRRPTRNRLGLSRVGSSPASVDRFCWYTEISFLYVGKIIKNRIGFQVTFLS